MSLEFSFMRHPTHQGLGAEEAGLLRPLNPTPTSDLTHSTLDTPSTLLSKSPSGLLLEVPWAAVQALVQRMGDGPRVAGHTEPSGTPQPRARAGEGLGVPTGSEVAPWVGLGEGVPGTPTFAPLLAAEALLLLPCASSLHYGFGPRAYAYARRHLGACLELYAAAFNRSLPKAPPPPPPVSLALRLVCRSV